MSEANPQPIYRNDYRVPDFQIPEVRMFIFLNEEETLVKSKLSIFRNPDAETASAPLRLIGEELELVEIYLDGEALSADQYIVHEDGLEVPSVPEKFTLETVVRIHPETNNTGEGLYRSGQIFCSQNEPEGFRRITYHLDRPDVMGIYTVTLEADKTKYPFLLCNGNEVAAENLEGGRHRVTWHDPFFKPTYLFAVVAGDLEEIKDTYQTTDGRTIDLRVYVDHGNASRADFCMESLKNSMKWDEDRFGLSCDLDRYMIVAVDTFNMGAMENKGLNIFNSRYVLADTDSATDQDFYNVEAVVGHEYFHNWTGNRVTCRDWFQLTLKEGLTVFRDQEFSADMNSRPVSRIQQVAGLRAAQFQEDASPMAHPIRPDSYIKIDNFYTSTVYSKGAEVIRMIETLIGPETFNQGITKYFELFDGQAVTCDDFVYAMELASGRDLTQFKRWYSQAGTPELTVTDAFDEATGQYTLTVKQSTPKQPENQPFHLPIKTGLISQTGEVVAEKVLELTEAEQTFTFEGLAAKPIPSLLRDFSAPVNLVYDYSDEDLIFLIKHDNNPFNRYEASQRLAKNLLLKLTDLISRDEECKVTTPILEAYKAVLLDETLDPAIKSKILTLPSLATVTDAMETPDFDNAFKAIEFLVKSLGLAMEFELVAAYDKLRNVDADPKFSGERMLKSVCLMYLSELGNMYRNVVVTQFKEANNMTDSITALGLLAHMFAYCRSAAAGPNFPEKAEAMQSFYDRWRNDSLTLDKWFMVQANSKATLVLEKVKELAEDPAFDKRNPNKLRALYYTFARNLLHFHKTDGSGYQFVAEKVIEIDQFNPSVAAGLSRSFKQYKTLDATRQALVKGALESILAAKPSNQTYEIVSRILNG